MKFEVFFDSEGGAATEIEAEFYELTNGEVSSFIHGMEASKSLLRITKETSLNVSVALQRGIDRSPHKIVLLGTSYRGKYSES